MLTSKLHHTVEYTLSFKKLVQNQKILVLSDNIG